MSTDEIEPQLKQLIVEALLLDDVTVGDIDTDAALFGEGLGLDSIDALELAIAIERRFGVKIQPNEEDAPRVFASVRSLAAHIIASSTAPGQASAGD